MSTVSISIFPEMPLSTHWSSDDIAAAFPRRLSDSYSFVPESECHARSTRRQRTYLPAAAHVMFRIGG